MCANCRSDYECDCDGGSVLVACGCDRGYSCVSCGHRPVAGVASEPEVLMEMISPELIADVSADAG